VPTYSQKDFERIATAIGVSPANVMQHRSEFEAAAKWYRLNVPSANLPVNSAAMPKNVQNGG